MMKKKTAAAAFANLREFIRGYFHQDLQGEYGSPAGAVKQFCNDAGRKQAAVTFSEWEQFLKKISGRPVSEINSQLQREFGSSWSLGDQAGLDSITEAFRACLKQH